MVPFHAPKFIRLQFCAPKFIMLPFCTPKFIMPLFRAPKFTMLPFRAPQCRSCRSSASGRRSTPRAPLTSLSSCARRATGRMRFGRCMRENHGSVGCAAVVLPHLDQKCSARRACALTIPDATLHNIHPCPKELMPYLEASYECITGKKRLCYMYLIRKTSTL